MRLRFTFWLLLLLRLAARASAQACYDVPSSPAPAELSLCGNGLLEVGEVCDDGNRLEGDGCSSFCSHFDYAPAAATLAGGPTPCPDGRTVLGGPTASVQFCQLTAVDAAIDGSYVLLADGAQVLRYDLFTDQTAGTIYRLPAGIRVQFTLLCSIGVLAPDSSFFLHDCGASRFYLVTPNGAQATLVTDLSGAVKPSPSSFKAYYDRTGRFALTAGVPVGYSADASTGNSVCVAVHRLNATTTTLFASIPCTAYGVWENGARYASFDMRGMQPYLIAHDACPVTFRANSYCYHVYMQRAAHMDLVRAILPDDGGFDLQYIASTANLYDNALGAPFVRTGDGMVYTLRGACLQGQSRFVTPSGRVPPPFSLGNACRRVGQLGLRCATPLNNPFITDVVNSPILVPDGLSAAHTHDDLVTILGANCRALANVTSAGPLLYHSVLSNLYGNTTPVDFVELPSTKDLLYVTPTSVGLISTKGILLHDRAQPGYVRATNVIHCPPLWFGYVGVACRPCNDTAAPGYYVSIAWQIQCIAGNTAYASDLVSAPFETFTLILSPNVSASTVHSGICLFMQSKGAACSDPSAVAMQPPQPYNVGADAGPTTTTSLFPCLLSAAQASTGRTLAPANPAELNARVISAGHTLRPANAIRSVAPASRSDPVIQACYSKLSKGLSAFLSCAAPHQQQPQEGGSGGGRRLLQQTSTSTAVITEHQGVSMASNTAVSYSRVLPSSNDGTISLSNGTRALSTTDAGAFPMWIAAIIGGGSAVVVIGLFLFLYFHLAGQASAAAYKSTGARFAYRPNRAAAPLLVRP